MRNTKWLIENKKKRNYLGTPKLNNKIENVKDNQIEHILKMLCLLRNNK